MCCIFDSAEPHSALWSQMGVEVGARLTVQEKLFDEIKGDV
jgi:hypothetical protein